MRHNQNRRARGRNRKGPNPLTRSYESNGPDVKVRGSAAHIAEKYQTFARDALSAGDPIAAEAYFQHAEHYSRIIAAAQAQQAENQARREESSQRENGVDREAEQADRGAVPAARQAADQTAMDQPEISEPAAGANGADVEEQPRPKRRRTRRKPDDATPVEAANGDDKPASEKDDGESDGEEALAAFPET